MSRMLFAVALASAIVPAYAADPPPPPPNYVPIVIEQSEFENIEKYLGEQPAKFANPIINWLAGLEQKALDKAKKPAETK